MVYHVSDYATLRRAVEEFCAFLSSKQVPSEHVFDSKLVAYELLGNVLQHSEGSAQLCGGVTDGYVEIKIVAEKKFCPPTKKECADVYSEHGRGLFLVDKVCTERSCTQEGDIFVRIKIVQRG